VSAVTPLLTAPEAARRDDTSIGPDVSRGPDDSRLVADARGALALKRGAPVLAATGAEARRLVIRSGPDAGALAVSSGELVRAEAAGAEAVRRGELVSAASGAEANAKEGSVAAGPLVARRVGEAVILETGVVANGPLLRVAGALLTATVARGPLAIGTLTVLEASKRAASSP
jgi:hypothetical protein